MRIEHQRVTCTCGKVCDVEIVVDAPINVVTASMEAARCPDCGSQNLFLGGEHAGVPPVSTPIEARIGWWRKKGSVGTSSLTIWCAMTEALDAARVKGMEEAAEIAAMSSGIAADVERAIRAAIEAKKAGKG